MKVLVTYATRHGSTRGIAERIGEVLDRHGLEVTLRPVEEAGSVDAYDAFVIGGAAYMFHWMKEASTFVNRHRALLASRPVWLFSSGPTGPEGLDAKGKDPLKESVPREFAELATAIHPRDQRIFYGAYNPDGPPVGLAEGFMVRFTRAVPSIKEAIPAGDFRDWPEIEAWAHGIAQALVPVGAATSG